MERVDNLTCDGCLHLQIKALTKKAPRHCAYCLRNNGETRPWEPSSIELLAHIMDCYINLAEMSLPTLTIPLDEKTIRERPKRKEKPRLT